LSARGTLTLLNHALLSAHSRLADVYVSQSQEKKHEAYGRAPEGAHCVDQDSFTAHKCLSAGGPRRTGHPFAVSGSKSRHRRLSWCSLPVPKQSVGAWGSDPSPSRQSAGPGSLRVHESRCFSFPLEGKVFYAATVRLYSSAGTKSCCLRSTASR
jgi:hypothetical protein